MSESKKRDETDETTTDPTTGAGAATASSTFHALNLAADAVCFYNRQTVAAKHPCWVVKESKELKTTVEVRRHGTTPVKAGARAESTRRPTSSKNASST